MKTNTVQTIVAWAVIVPCVVMIVLRTYYTDLEIPLKALVVYVIGLGAFTLFAKKEPQTQWRPDAAKETELFEHVRSRLMDWMKVQGLVLIVFVGVGGFYVIKEIVRDVVNEMLADVRNGLTHAFLACWLPSWN